MSTIGTQTPISFRRAFRIAVRGIRIRFGRSLVTVAGVALGVAFLMSNVTGQLIQRAVSGERDVRMKVNLMRRLLEAETGSLQDKTLAVLASGALRPEETALLRELAAARPAALRLTGASIAGWEPVAPDALGAGATVMLSLGDAPAATASLEALTQGMAHAIVLDSLGTRTYPTTAGGGAVRREFFFGARLAQEEAEQAAAAQQASFRLRWILAVSLLVTLISVSNALLMSVTERFREIGTMKCLGALSVFIRRLFLIESALIGGCGSLIGAVGGALLSIVFTLFQYGIAATLRSLPLLSLLAAVVGAVVTGTVLSVLAAIYPARFAARMLPAAALRSTV
jgi:hypothetical protein